MEVTLIIVPCPAFSSSSRPWASARDAKRFTWNTCCHISASQSRVPNLCPFAPFGEIPALFTSACRAPFYQPQSHLGDSGFQVVPVCKIDLYVILRPRLPWTVFRKWLPGAGDHPPAGAGEAFDRRVTDAAARPCKNECALAGLLFRLPFSQPRPWPPAGRQTPSIATVIILPP